MYSFIDMHCDSLLRVIEQGNASLYDGEGMQSIRRMAEAGQMCQFFAIFFAPEITQEEVYFRKLRAALIEQIEVRDAQIAMAYDETSLRKNWKQGKSSVLLSIEDGRIVKGKIEKLQYLYEQGVRAITLTWNHKNCFGYPSAKEAGLMKKGLTHFGRDAVEEMNRLGLLIDVSHLSDGGFWDVVHLSKKPFIASHSNCRELKKHPRNLTDIMIRALAEHGGAIGMNCYPDFVGNDSVEALAQHVLHVIKVGGEDCVGLGMDWDGFTDRTTIDSPSKVELLFDELHKRGVSERQLEKLARENVIRVMKDTL